MAAGNLAAPSMRMMIGRERDMGRLLHRGYVIAAADSRGSGASFGTRSGPYKDMSPPADAWDGYELVEWLAAQEWCSGAVAMYGASYEGRLQLEVAATQPPHLRAIFPEVALIDWYWTFVRGGIYSPMVWPGPGDRDPLSAPVDEDSDGSLLRAALAEHEHSTEWSLAELPFRNSWDAESGRAYYIDSDGFVLLDRIAAAGIAVYHIAGWWSIGPKWNTLAAYRRLNGRVPQRLMVGAWGSFVTDRDELAHEMGRFADHWLKGIDTGIMDKPPIRYADSALACERLADRRDLAAARRAPDGVDPGSWALWNGCVGQRRLADGKPDRGRSRRHRHRLWNRVALLVGGYGRAGPRLSGPSSTSGD